MIWLRALNSKLKGAPDYVLTLALIAVAVVAVAVAIKGRPLTKAFVAAWLIAP